MKPHNRGLFSDTIGRVDRDDPKKMFFIGIEARPEDDNPEAAEVPGGHVNVWVDADDLRAAEIEALSASQSERWKAHRSDDWALRSRVECPEQGLDSFDEAAENGISLSIFTWGHEE